MPFYDLHCNGCDKDVNVHASMAEKSEKRIPCPQCGSLDLETIYKAGPAYVKNTKEPVCPNSHMCGGGCRHAG